MTSNGTPISVEQLYRDYRPLLVSLSYRMLGSMSEAEDAAQDVFLAVSKLGDVDIAYPRAYLVKMATNRLLNLMRAAPRRRQRYPGVWLPEPVATFDPDDDPQERTLRRERLGYALLVLLQTCSPAERAVFVLRESLGCAYAEIADMLGKSEAACRKLHSRASAKVGRRAAAEDDTALDAAVGRFVDAFAQAIGSGRFETLLRLLTDDAVMLSDGGGVVRSALRPIRGRERIAAFFAGIARKGSLQGTAQRVRICGQHGFVLLRGDRPPFAFALAPDEGLGAIRAVYLVSNPDKLTRLALG